MALLSHGQVSSNKSLRESGYKVCKCDCLFKDVRYYQRQVRNLTLRGANSKCKVAHSKATNKKEDSLNAKKVKAVKRTSKSEENLWSHYITSKEIVYALGFSDSIALKTLYLHIANLISIHGIPHEPLSPPE